MFVFHHEADLLGDGGGGQVVLNRVSKSLLAFPKKTDLVMEGHPAFLRGERFLI